MADPNWQDQEEFQPNVACAFYLPPVHVEECRWQLWLVKQLDPIVCCDTCQCDCEDHVHFEETGVPPSNAKYCDFDPDPPAPPHVQAGWCGPLGPHNVLGTLPMFAGANTGMLTTFRSDNISGIGGGGLVYAITVPGNRKRSVRQPQPTAASPASLRHKAYCWWQKILCTNKNCKIPCVCYNNTQQRISCTLYDIFTDITGITARQNYVSTVDVVRRAAWLAVYNIGRFRRPVPTYTQLLHQQQTPTSHPTRYTTKRPTRYSTTRPIRYTAKRPTTRNRSTQSRRRYT